MLYFKKKRIVLNIILFSLIFNPVFMLCQYKYLCNSSYVEIDSFLAKDYCQKLKKHVDILNKFNFINKKYNLIDFNESQGDLFWKNISNFNNIEYKNEIIKICINSMIEQRSLEPFFKTWDYAYSLCISNTDMSFVREFSIVIFFIYENILTFILKQDKKTCFLISKNFLEDMIQLYNTISKLPIKEIIDALEKCYDVFLKILNDYGYDPKTSFIEWIKLHWWLFPAIFLSAVIAYYNKK